MAKTLIFCFDGTGNDPKDVGNFSQDESITNILKLHILFGGNLEDEPTIKNPMDSQQRSFYYSGVGTQGIWPRKWINKVFAPDFKGWFGKLINPDVRRILKTAIENLRDHYKDGDHVLVFGFSRGAALARRFAVVAREKAKISNLKIDFLGVFDTVAAMGVPDLKEETKPESDVVFENCGMSKDVEKAVHLVALDENRIAFRPTLFDFEPDRITEVWFPGVHSDVGGGYWYDGLSDLALDYMIKKIKQHCGEFVQILDPNIPGAVDYSKFFDQEDPKITEDDIVIRPIVKGVVHEHKRMRILARKTLRSRSVRITHPPKEEYPMEHPMVHVSVQERYESVTGYRPVALRDVKYVFLYDDDKTSPVNGFRRGISGLSSDKSRESGTTRIG